MNQDPIEALDQFYDSCRIAPVPIHEPKRWGLAFAIPVAGTALGFLAALGIALFPATPSQEVRRRTVEAIALRQQPPLEPLQKQGYRLVREGKKTWRA